MYSYIILIYLNIHDFCLACIYLSMIIWLTLSKLHDISSGMHMVCSISFFFLSVCEDLLKNGGSFAHFFFKLWINNSPEWLECKYFVTMLFFRHKCRISHPWREKENNRVSVVLRGFYYDTTLLPLNWTQIQTEKRAKN